IGHGSRPSPRGDNRHAPLFLHERLAPAPSRIAQRKSELRLYVKFFDTYYVTIFRVEKLTARRSWPSFVRNTQPAPNCNGTPRAEPVRVIPLAAPRLEVG